MATVTFSAPAFTGGAAISGYTVSSNDGIISTGTASPILITGLSNGVAYTFTVTATGPAGDGQSFRCVEQHHAGHRACGCVGVRACQQHLPGGR